MFLWVKVRKDSSRQAQETDLFPFVFMSGAAFPATFLPVLTLGFDLFFVSLVVASCVFCTLGTVVGFLWKIQSWVLGAFGAIPSVLFVLALHDWSPLPLIRDSMTLLPVACWLFGWFGTVLGSTMARRRNPYSE